MSRTGFFTMWRCGCTLLSEDHKHPIHCPHHAPGVTSWNGSVVAARTERLAPTEAVTFGADVALGLEVSNA